MYRFETYVGETLYVCFVVKIDNGRIQYSKEYKKEMHRWQKM